MWRESEHGQNGTAMTILSTGAKSISPMARKPIGFALLARTSDGNDYKGMSLIIVPTDTPGFIVSRKLKKLGQHSSDTAVLSFENMRVPVKNRIGDEGKGFYYQMGQFQVERLVGAIGATAAAEQAVRDNYPVHTGTASIR